jgi:hypothetical protein
MPFPHHQIIHDYYYYYYYYYYFVVSALCVVGIQTRYGQDSPRIESRWERDYPHPSNPNLVPTQPPIKWTLGLFREGKAAGAWR